ncbi:MAG: acetyl-CoA carboxylase carboxyltransferase subunit alpha [Puniceicoccales bacterium]|jgi:acetyl-CoA carboxylase carboxyl transferase subunit alpha|nr:acetyl-CoA carboxylase carboxyltransferase subunit alpha [Puniceicoccales bacterium]
MEHKVALDFEKPIQDLANQLEILAKRAAESAGAHSDENDAIAAKMEALKVEMDAAKCKIYKNLTEWQRVQLARHPLRPYALDYVSRIFSDFQELHGDRLYADDQSMVGGIARFGNEFIMVIAQQKGRTIKDNIQRNFGMQNPEGYRKAMRLMKLAARFGMPIVAFVDTPGAFPGIESEERHVAEAIAVNLRDMMLLRTPIIAVVIGEGGSGGALGIAIADRVLVMENSYYSVISPEGCAAILWGDRTKAPEAAEALRLCPQKLVEFGVADEIIEEPLGGAHNDYDGAADAIAEAIGRNLVPLKKLKGDAMLQSRYERFRKIGIFSTAAAAQ